jgi:phosphate:Na+ symporter
LETIVSIVGGVGLFLLGMAVMTDGLKALAGTALTTVLEKAAATPLLGTFWGAVIYGQVLSFGILILPSFSLFSVFALMAVILIVRPWGLFGRPIR